MIGLSEVIIVGIREDPSGSSAPAASAAPDPSPWMPVIQGIVSAIPLGKHYLVSYSLKDPIENISNNPGFNFSKIQGGRASNTNVAIAAVLSSH